MTRNEEDSAEQSDTSSRTRRRFLGAVAAGGVLAGAGSVVGTQGTTGQETTTGRGTTDGQGTTTGLETTIQRTTGVNGTVETATETETLSETTIVDGQDILFWARQGGWFGRQPRSIRRQTNPRLALQDGQTYRIRWRNLDGLPHNFSFFDQQGLRLPILRMDSEELARTPVVSERGVVQTFEFTATPEIGTYLCNVHPLTMQGNVFVWTGEI